MPTYNVNTLVQIKDGKGNYYIEYPITKYDNVIDAPVVYHTLTAIASNLTESTSLVDIFNAMATPSRLVCNISNGTVYPASSGTLAINKTSANTGTAMFIDYAGKISTGVFTENSTGGGYLVNGTI